MDVTHIHHVDWAYKVPRVAKVALFETHYLYLIVHLITIVPVFMLSFDKKVHFYKSWRFMWQGGLAVGLFFIAWDMWKTHLGIWSFNRDYVLGYYLYNLPFEELLFFVTVPYACLFIYECLNKYYSFTTPNMIVQAISVLLFFLLLFITVQGFEHTYTFVTGVIALAYLTYHMAYESLVVRMRFYIAFLVTLLPFFVVDGILTGAFQQEPVVLYNPKEFLGLRIGSVPLEDIVYLIPLMLASITFYENNKKRVRNHEGHKKSL